MVTTERIQWKILIFLPGTWYRWSSFQGKVQVVLRDRYLRSTTDRSKVDHYQPSFPTGTAGLDLQVLHVSIALGMLSGSFLLTSMPDWQWNECKDRQRELGNNSWTWRSKCMQGHVYESTVLFEALHSWSPVPFGRCHKFMETAETTVLIVPSWHAENWDVPSWELVKALPSNSTMSSYTSLGLGLE